MARLPQPGGDDNAWGTLLNQFLSESHATDGSLKSGSVGAGQLQDGAVTAAKISASGAADGKALTVSGSGLAWADKEAVLPTGTTAQYLRGDKSWQTLDKTAVGLANVNNTADTAKPLSTAATTALDGKASFVLVVTGAEVRPSGPFCIWAGGTVQPTNMGASDLWFAAALPPDTVPPSVPTGLAASSVLATSFNLTWTASTGNPTLYQVYIDGLPAGTSSSTNLNISGKVGSTTYSVTVSARDAAGNWSAQSSAISVTTTAPSSVAEHSVYAATVPASASYFNDGGASLWFANQFYTTDSAAEPWKIVGGRFYVPAGASNIPGKKLAMRLIIKPQNSGSNQPASSLDVNTDMLEQQVITLSTGWNEIRWSTSYDYASSKGSRIFVAGKIFTGNDPSSGTGEYLFSSVSGNAAAVQATDGSSLYRAAAAEYIGWNNIGGYVDGAYYGMDVILAES